MMTNMCIFDLQGPKRTYCTPVIKCTNADLCVYWAIPLFSYTPLQMTINGVQGGIGNMSRGVVI